jgi:hypothetical protein
LGTNANASELPDLGCQSSFFSKPAILVDEADAEASAVTEA